ncbi:MAG: NlpC/P60 family protein [Nocardioidaceae bacterium]
MSAGRTPGVKRVLAAASAAALASVILPASAGHAEPSIGAVEQRLDTLYHQAEAAQERLNSLNLQLAEKRERLSALRSDLPAQRRVYHQVSEKVAGMAAAEAQSVESQLTMTQQFWMSRDPRELLDRMAAQDALSRKKGATLTRLTTVSRALREREQQVSREVAAVRAHQQQAATEENAVDANVAQAEDLLAELEAERRAELRAARARAAERRAEALREARAEAEQQAARQQETQEPSRSRPQPQPQTSPVSSRAGTAVDFAMDQIGDSYVYGAAGPDSWDCSGLTMQAWGAAGVGLPHSSSAQFSSAPQVSTSSLQPGDLVFYYSPISHVAMYIGNGQIVHASNPSYPVKVDPVNSMPISGAVRPG